MTTRFKLRPAEVEELPALSALCLRSKAYWGYDAAFMAACVPVLTLTEADLSAGPFVVAETQGRAAGLAQVTGTPDSMEIDLLFVDPEFIGTGCGRVLFDWCTTTAAGLGAKMLRIEADPGAAPFYEKMGAVRVGDAPSTAVAGRSLPLLEMSLS
ncbi:MAG: GNAT family N-acetyltransferase [Pseudomonadota bacterium]